MSSVLLCDRSSRVSYCLRKLGRHRIVNDRTGLNGILHVLQTGIPRNDLPQEFGFGHGMTCRRRLRDWQVERV
ncbi:transposase [Burkholderia lata]|uniref:transposase n=1 Tax=Burkholderia lata (strain ATCC 17760 / DSM 23089 / LMG 22485 / NCIMB 9086 / R18194 / 383) TaxID=482957 RepID=UPI003F689D2C